MSDVPDPPVVKEYRPARERPVVRVSNRRTRAKPLRHAGT